MPKQMILQRQDSVAWEWELQWVGEEGEIDRGLAFLGLAAVILEPLQVL